MSSTANPSPPSPTVILAVDVSVPPAPLETVHVKLATPSKFAAGMNIKPPCVSNERKPESG